MSATNRQGLVRHEGDFYETPAAAIDVVLDALELDAATRLYVVDAGSGSGAIAHRVATRCPLADVRGVELNPALVEVARATRAANVAFEQGSWLDWEPDGAPDLVIANPPYQAGYFDPEALVTSGKRKGEKGRWICTNPHLAEDFIRKALSVVSKRGRVAMLLRDSFMLPAARRALREDFGLPDRHCLENRPSFNGSGTDACDYAWHIWDRAKRGGRWFVHGTSSSVRTATSA